MQPGQRNRTEADVKPAAVPIPRSAQGYFRLFRPGFLRKGEDPLFDQRRPLLIHDSSADGRHLLLSTASNSLVEYRGFRGPRRNKPCVRKTEIFVHGRFIDQLSLLQRCSRAQFHSGITAAIGDMTDGTVYFEITLHPNLEVCLCIERIRIRAHPRSLLGKWFLEDADMS